MIQEIIFGVVGGLGLFIFGIHIMSEGMQKIAGDRLRNVLAKFTTNRLTGNFLPYRLNVNLADAAEAKQPTPCRNVVLTGNCTDSAIE